jgi:FdhD protein
MQALAPSRQVDIEIIRYGGSDGRPTRSAGEQELAEEVPVNLAFGGIPFAVMMASPGDLSDFAYGFSLTEGIIKSAQDIRHISQVTDDRGIRLDIDLSSDVLSAHLARSRGRSIAGRTGCGLCGVVDFDGLPELPVQTAPVPPIDVAIIEKAVGELGGAQTLNRLTRAVHGAAWFDLSGRLVQIREDVGRHNALDKLIGGLVRHGIDPQDGFLVITSRCSFEMVQKAIIFGARHLVAVSAPTGLALDLARAHHLNLFAVARMDGVIAFYTNDQHGLQEHAA